MSRFFMSWKEFFGAIRREQPSHEGWFDSALFNDRGALVDKSPEASRPEEPRPPASGFRIRRDVECYSDLRGSQKKAPLLECKRERDWTF
jgi:hypothetical protein